MHPLVFKDCEVIVQFFFDKAILQHSNPQKIMTDNAWCRSLWCSNGSSGLEDERQACDNKTHTIPSAMTLWSTWITLYVPFLRDMAIQTTIGMRCFTTSSLSTAQACVPARRCIPSSCSTGGSSRCLTMSILLAARFLNPNPLMRMWQILIARGGGGGSPLLTATSNECNLCRKPTTTNTSNSIMHSEQGTWSVMTRRRRARAKANSVRNTIGLHIVAKIDLQEWSDVLRKLL